MLEIDDPRYFRTESGQKMYALFKEKNVNLNYLRNDGLIYTENKSLALAFYEMQKALDDIANYKNFRDVKLSRQQINSEKTLVDLNNLLPIQRQIYFFLNNTRNPDINYYSINYANFYINEAQKNIGSFENVYLIIIIIAISVSFLLSMSVVPIIVRIESNKEKVFFIYAELSRNDIDERKRNIKIFFAKLRQST
jgi:hypothetical protein